MGTDRTVHGLTNLGNEVVHRAGKWWIECHRGSRTPISVGVAAEMLSALGAMWSEGQPGGRALDAAVRQRLSSDGRTKARSGRIVLGALR